MGKNKYDEDEYLEEQYPGQFKAMADQLQQYLDHINEYIIFVGLSKKDELKAKKKLKKAIKCLRNGEAHKVIDADSFHEISALSDREY